MEKRISTLVRQTGLDKKLTTLSDQNDFVRLKVSVRILFSPKRVDCSVCGSNERKRIKREEDIAKVCEETIEHLKKQQRCS